MNKKFAALILTVCMLTSMWSFHFQVSALNNSPIENNADTVPCNSDDYLQYLEDIENGVPSRFGGIVPPQDIEYVDASDILKGARANSFFPDVYDPRPLGLVSPVKNQSGRSTCAVYSADSNLESLNLKRFGSTPIYSEEYFDYFTASDAFGPNTYNPYTYGKRLLHKEATGDTKVWYSSAVGYGPVLETQFPYGSQGYLSDDTLLKTPQSLVVYDYYVAPWLNMSSYTPAVTQARVNEIKELITENGSCILYNRNDYPYADSNVRNVYTPIQEILDIIANGGEYDYNHAVTLVGWDDHYSKNNFIKTPQNDGAFIVKNSWGTSSGYKGYFYLSYEDYFICANGPRGVTDASAEKRYDKLYTHTQFGGNQNSIFISQEAAFWNANIYEIKGDQPQQLESIGIELRYSKNDYEVYINQNVGAPGSRVLNPADMVKIYSGYHDKRGYHTIMLDEPVKLNSSNGKFAIVVKYNDDGDGNSKSWGSCWEKRQTDSNGNIYLHANPGESFYSLSKDGIFWSDSAVTHGINFIINAYTNDIDENLDNPLSIQFTAPENWGDSANITFYNAGALSGQAIKMDKLASGQFIYRNANQRQATFIIDDGEGHKTKYLYACGSAMVEDDTVSYVSAPMQVDFKKPDGWGNSIKTYYYSNNAAGTASKPWPGTSMINLSDGWYRYYITDMEDVRVVFNDSSGHQNPAALKEGIPLKSGQNLIWQEGGYLYDDGTPISIRFYPPEIVQDYKSFRFRIDTGTNIIDGLLEDSGKGYCEYSSDTLMRGKLQIFANGGSVIYDALISGGVTVNGTKLYSKPKEPIEIRFQPPSSWSDSVHIYYYTDDERYIEHSSWPGEAMTAQDDGWYTYTVSDMDNIRILFTDETRQLPSLLQEGQPAQSGQSLIFQDKTCIYDDGETLLDVRFYKPDDWDDNVYITVRDLDSTFAPATMMNEQGGSLFTKAYSNRTIAEITISDTSGHQTKKFIAAGKVTVSNNTAVQRAKTPIPITFEKPARWGNNIFMYVFTNDDSYTSFSSWPGTPLTKSPDGKYRGEITDTCNARVFFSDGANQYPLPTGLNGIPVKEGQALYFNGISYQVSKT